MSGKILEVRRLRKTFDGAPVLKDISFSVDRGEVIVIVGPSGCGKSTLLRCINGLEHADGGEILLNGNRINTDAKDMYLTRRRIGMVFQSYELFPHLDVMGNLLLGPVKALRSDADRVRAEASTLLKRVGLEGREHALPRTLSGGQKQRIALVRAMLMHPELLLLDEITAALDPEMVHEVLNVVLDLAADGMTMLIVTHEMRFAEAVADRILFLDEGLVAEESAPEIFSHGAKTARAQSFLQGFDFEARRLKS